MINMDLVELQKGCQATCVIIEGEDIDKLDSKVVINSNCIDSELINTVKAMGSEQPSYFVIEKIDEIDMEVQDRFYQIVKDREFNGYELPKDTIIVLTVKNKEGLKNISQELYHLSVVAF